VFYNAYAFNLEQIIQYTKSFPLNKKIEYISEQFQGKRYGHTLTKWPNEERVVKNLDTLDCFTYLDYVLALTVINSPLEFQQQVINIRYKDGKVSYATRNHFFVEWIDNNQKLLDNIALTSNNSKHISKYLKILGTAPVEKEIYYIPFKECYNILETGDFVGFYTNRTGLDVSHTGIIIRKDKLYLRHFSSLAKGYEEIELEKYIKNKNVNKVRGLIVARLR
jgi:hypothetical protein